MPQFDPANFAPQFAWLALVFAVLYFGVVRLTLPRLGKVVTAREDMVKGDLDAAHHAKAEADGTRALYESAMVKARHDAQSLIGQSKSRAADLVENRLKALDAALEEKTLAAEQAIARDREAAEPELVRIAGDAATEIVVMLTGSRPEPQSVANAVASARAA